MDNYTSEQRAAIESGGKVIVSASAGSGKTFVMIEKLTRAVLGGADLDSVLAVTFTKKAAAQMKDKLRSALISRVAEVPPEERSRLKAQISKIPSADISTIHSFCARLIRTYFYLLDVDAGFEITADDAADAKELKARAIDGLFERLYAAEDDGFLHLLKRFTRKRSDGALKKLVLEAYSTVRNLADYRQKLGRAAELYTESGFERVCEGLRELASERAEALEKRLEEFSADFPVTANDEAYRRIFGEMAEALEQLKRVGPLGPAIKPVVTKKPRDSADDAAAGELFKAFRDEFCDEFKDICPATEPLEEELARFTEAGRTATAFCGLVLAFDDEYTAVKRDENKLDYNDLEHLALKLLESPAREEICGKYGYVFVDEYQDVNPVQEAIISAIGRESFLVGDVKQAIYGFRGSKSLFFAEKYKKLEGDGTALRLTGNFRSAAPVLEFVNKVFSEAMRADTCGFDYRGNSEMTALAPYPAECGSAKIVLFGSNEKSSEPEKVYSVKDDGRQVQHTREGLAVLKIVERELASKRYDTAAKTYVDVQAGDICILTRKNRGGSAEGIIRALTDAGYAVSGGQEGNICGLPEVKRILDILSLIDNAEQDVPQVTAMLSPLGGFTPDELAAVRIAFKQRIPFRTCCVQYASAYRDKLAAKIVNFYKKLQTLRDRAEILTAGELVDGILAESGMEAEYSAGGGEKLKNIMKLMAEGPGLSVSAFLRRIRAGGYNVKSAAAAPTDSIKIMTMHAAKGLEFPIVILADICRTFKGRDVPDMPFDEDYGFAPKCYDADRAIALPTLLRRLVRERAEREELKNELNLFYVACTRATERLYVTAAEAPAYSRLKSLTAKDYAHTFDMRAFPAEVLEPEDFERQGVQDVGLAAEPDADLLAGVLENFMRPYANAAGVDLPVKSSASAILKSRDGEGYYAERSLFGGEGETAERGTAYHRFLELCDFSVTSPKDISAEIAAFVAKGLMPEEQAGYLEPDNLAEILAMPVFSGLCGATLYREREFLCRIKAAEILETEAEDYVLVQGAIDLMADFGKKLKIIDYKYSAKSDEELVKTYSPQLSLYKRAASIITHIPPEDISTVIVNIRRRTQINL